MPLIRFLHHLSLYLLLPHHPLLLNATIIIIHLLILHVRLPIRGLEVPLHNLPIRLLQLHLLQLVTPRLLILFPHLHIKSIHHQFLILMGFSTVELLGRHADV